MGALVTGLPAFGDPLDGESLRRLTGHPEQVVGAELLRRSDGAERGVRVVHLRSGEAEFEIVVDRALDVAAASVRGVPVAWRSPTGIAGPWFAEPSGLGTFRTFFGGLLTTCGLAHTLGPTEDDVGYFHYPGKQRERFPLHGRVSVTPARLSAYGAALDGERPHVYVEGEVRDATVFGEALTLRRRLEVDVGGRTLRVADAVRNLGYAPTPHMILYHWNLGWPLVAPGARVHASVGEPRVGTPSTAGVDWQAIEPPRRGAVEQVWEHTPRVGEDARVHAALVNPDVGGGRAVGVELVYDPATLPRLFQWRVMSEGHYVIGLEPGNLPIEGRQAARERGELVVLEPGQEVRYGLELRLLWGPAELDAAIARCGAVTSSGG